MTLNKFDFAATNEANAYGAAIQARVEAGRDALQFTAKRTHSPQPAAAV